MSTTLALSVSQPVAVGAALLATAAYVHGSCVDALGANSTDNIVVVHPYPDPSASATSSSQSQSHHNKHPASEPHAVVEPLPDDKAPILVILGWGGSTRKQLRRILEFCNHSLHCPIISYINPMMQFLHGALDQTAMEKILQNLQEQLSAPGSAKRGFVVYVHSNNGAFVYGELKARLQEENGKYSHLYPRFKGVIFDSAPANFDEEKPQNAQPNLLVQAWKSVYAAFRFTFPSVAIVRKRPQYLHWFWTPAIFFWVIFYKTILKFKAMFGAAPVSSSSAAITDSRQVLRSQLRSDVPRVPHLFLYSHGDKLLPSKFVENYIQHVKTNYPETPVQVHDFKTTGHVQHFLKEGHKYATLVREFLLSIE